MRKLTYLFAFYVLLLTAIPCNPQDNCCSKEMNLSSKSGLPANSKPEFPCSPFFACGANHGIVIPNLEIKISRPEHYTKNTRTLITEEPSFISLSPIWQPPKQG